MLSLFTVSLLCLLTVNKGWKVGRQIEKEKERQLIRINARGRDREKTLRMFSPPLPEKSPRKTLFPFWSSQSHSSRQSQIYTTFPLTVLCPMRGRGSLCWFPRGVLCATEPIQTSPLNARRMWSACTSAGGRSGGAAWWWFLSSLTELGVNLVPHWGPVRRLCSKGLHIKTPTYPIPPLRLLREFAISLVNWSCELEFKKICKSNCPCVCAMVLGPGYKSSRLVCTSGTEDKGRNWGRMSWRGIWKKLMI